MQKCADQQNSMLHILRATDNDRLGGAYILDATALSI